MMKVSRTFAAVPPGYTIKEQLEDRVMTQKELALRMDISEKHISRLLNGEVRLTPNTAMRLESVLGIPASFWNNLEADYRAKMQQAEEENAMDADIELARHIPYAEMVSLGWIEAARKATDKVRNLRRYFEVSHLGVLEDLKMPGIAYRRMMSNEKSDYALAVWAQRARILARDMDVSPINLQKLTDEVPEIRSMTKEEPEEFMPKMTCLFSGCGIAAVFLPHMKESFVQGASFMYGRKIVLALTFRSKGEYLFWMSLFHEIGHILNGHLNKPSGLVHEDEIQADKYAKDVLIPPCEYDRFISSGEYTHNAVMEFAEDIGIDAGVVVGRLQREGYVSFNQLNDLKRSYEMQ